MFTEILFYSYDYSVKPDHIHHLCKPGTNLNYAGFSVFPAVYQLW